MPGLNDTVISHNPLNDKVSLGVLKGWKRPSYKRFSKSELQTDDTIHLLMLLTLQTISGCFVMATTTNKLAKLAIHAGILNTLPVP